MTGIRGRILCLALAIGVMMPAMGMAQQKMSTATQQITLSQAIQTALANANDIKQALLDVKDADQQVLASWGELMPTVKTDMSYSRNFKLQPTFVPKKLFDPTAADDELEVAYFGAQNNWSGGIMVTQTLFRGAAFVGVSTSDLYKLAQKENYRAAAQKVVTDTRVAYYNVLIAHERLRLQESTINRLQENLKENEARVAAGLVDDYDVLRLKVQLKNEEPNLLSAQNAIKTAMRSLKIQMGVPLDTPFEVVGDLKNYDIKSAQASSASNNDLKKIDRMTPLDSMTDENLRSALPDLRGDLRAMDVRLKLQDKQIMANESEYLPTLTTSYSVRWVAANNGSPEFFGPSSNRGRSHVLSVNFSLPLFEGFKTSTKVQQAKIEKKSLEENRDFTLRNAINQTLTAQESIQQLYEVSNSVTDALSLARTGYNRATVRKENGVGSQLELTDAELQLRTAEVNYATMVYNYLKAKAQYDLSLGMVPFVNQRVQ